MRRLDSNHLDADWYSLAIHIFALHATSLHFAFNILGFILNKLGLSVGDVIYGCDIFSSRIAGDDIYNVWMTVLVQVGLVLFLCCIDCASSCGPATATARAADCAVWAEYFPPPLKYFCMQCDQIWQRKHETLGCVISVAVSGWGNDLHNGLSVLMMQHTLDISSVDTLYLLYLLYLRCTPPLMQDTLGTQCPNRAFPDLTRVMNESLV